MRNLLFLLALMLFGVAFAQDLPGVPAEYTPLLTVAIALVSAVLVQPLTSIAKKLGGTSGPTTVVISAVLSVVVAVGFALWQAAVTRSGAPLGAALFAALLAFLKANGDYLTRVFSALKSSTLTPAATVVMGDVTPPGSGLEGLPLSAGAANSVMPPVAPANPAGLGLMNLAPLGGTDLSGVVASVLQSAGLPATTGQIVAVSLRLAKVAPDLLDGSAYLSAESRNTILGVIMDLKQGGQL